ncbi:MAG: hypothetical protein KIS65_09235, partial [Nitrosomonas sp.]|nr:hypothetical protein [Nitrosomonas sp.]
AKVSFRTLSSEVTVFSIANRFIFSGVYPRFFLLFCRKKMHHGISCFIGRIVIAEKNPISVESEWS